MADFTTHTSTQIAPGAEFIIFKLAISRPRFEAPPNGGNRFYSPLSVGGLLMDYGNKYLNVTSVTPPISDGLLLVFPSFLMHSALPYSGVEDRIVIAFNSRSHLTARKA